MYLCMYIHTYTYSDNLLYPVIMALRTIHIEVMDKGRFNPQHTIGQAKPLLAPWLRGFPGEPSAALESFFVQCVVMKPR